jgi:tetratricopeptide (TPR) repeat protein
LHRSVRAELRSLPKELAEIVASHLVVAGQLIDDEPELAYLHAEAARRRAARLPIVREAAAETAYAAGRYDIALSEFRALRRMTGTHDYLPVMADCERDLEPALRVEMTIVEAGARRDLGQDAEARRLLERAVKLVRPDGGLAQSVARLRYAYADALAAADEPTEARHWFAAAAQLDPDQETDAQARMDELDGFMIEFDDAEDETDEEIEPEQAGSTDPEPVGPPR